MSRSLAKKEAAQQQIAQQQQHERQLHARDVEVQEHKASANAEAGLNLNLFGALSGVFSSKSKKTTHTNPDGSSESVEDRHEQAAGQGYAQGNGAAYAKGSAVDQGRKIKAKEIGQSTKQQQSQGMIQGRQKVDHLGIEN